MNLPDRIKKKLRDLPDAPGVYLMRDRRGRIIYVGKALSLRKRVGSYFRKAALRSGSPKFRGLVRSVDDLDVIVVRNEAEAVLTEGRLIKEYRPRYNVSFRDDKRFLLLRLNPTDPFPRLSLCRIRRDDGALYFGPYASSAAARATLDFTEKHFGLRKCTPRVPLEETRRHCLNDIVRYCSAPCVGKVTAVQYRDRVQQACAFLRGERRDILAEVRQKMEDAAAGQDFERAAALRDTLFMLEAAVKQRARVAATPEMKTEAARQGVRELGALLGLSRPPRRIEACDISQLSGTHAVAGLVCAVDGVPQRNRYRRFRIRSEQGLDDAARMAEVIRRRFRRLREENGALPDLLLVDGGVTQVGAARRELRGLGLPDVAVAGLAKRFEEIHGAKGTPVIRLPRGSQALQVLQRLRDEAHRFALTYHRRLRGRRIRESVLDGVPGIGAKRKRQLLDHFGSVYRLARAAEAEIAAVPGIGPATACAIRQALAGDAGGAGSAKSE